MSLQEVKRRMTELERQLAEIRTEIGRSPLRIEPAITVQKYSFVRRAKIQSVAAATISVKLLDSAGAETGDAFNVSPIEELGDNDLNGNVWPKYAADKIISIFKDVNGTWYTTPPFDDQKVCSG